MNKWIVSLLMILCLLGGAYFWYTLWLNYSISVWFSTENSIKNSSDRSITGITLQENQQPLQFNVAPMIPSECEKFSNMEKENCLFSIAIRSAKNASDISVCKTLANPQRCEKAISDQFSAKYNIPYPQPHSTQIKTH